MDIIQQSLQYGKDMRRIAWEGALHMAKVYKDTGGDLDEYIKFLEEKVAEEAKEELNDCA